MTSFCQSILSAGKFTFNCPYDLGHSLRSSQNSTQSSQRVCNREWPYFVVRHVACLSEEEMKAFEKKASENYMNKAAGVQQCPGCRMWSYRGDTRSNRVRCVVCTKRNTNPFEFCWACLSEWDPEAVKCVNADCDGMDSRMRILRNCPEKDLEGRGQMAPSIRGCAKCGMLIEHKKDCKHMVCVCGYGFCFICLKPRKTDGMWQCGAYSVDCTVAARQTSLPGTTR